MENNIKIFCKPLIKDNEILGFSFEDKNNNEKEYFLFNYFITKWNQRREINEEKRCYFLDNSFKYITKLNIFDKFESVEEIIENIYSCLEDYDDSDIEKKYVLSFYNLLFCYNEFYKNGNRKNFSSFLKSITSYFNLEEIDFIIKNFYFDLKYLIKIQNINKKILVFTFLRTIENENIEKNIDNLKNILILIKFLNSKYFENGNNNINDFININKIISGIFTIRSYNTFFNFILNDLIKLLITNLNLDKYDETTKERIYEYYYDYSSLSKYIKIGDDEDINKYVELLIIKKIFKTFLAIDFNYFDTLTKRINLNNIFDYSNISKKIISFLFEFVTINNIYYFNYNINDVVKNIINYLFFSKNNSELINSDSSFSYYNDNLFSNYYFNSIFDKKIKLNYITKNLNTDSKNLDEIKYIISSKFNFSFCFSDENIFSGKRKSITKYKSSKLKFKDNNILYIIQIDVTDEITGKKFMIEINFDKILRIKNLSNIYNIYNNDDDYMLEIPYFKVYEYNKDLSIIERSEEERDIEPFSIIELYNNSMYINMYRSLFTFLSYYDLIKNEDKSKKIFNRLINL